jgi:hypothetical protein
MLASRRMRLPTVLLALLAGLAASGCSKKDELPGCDAGVAQLCAWNADTKSYDRDCRMACATEACASGPNPQRRCQWDDATMSYTRGCVFGCGAPPVVPSDGGCDPAAFTTYFANDPRCDTDAASD